MKRWEQYRKHIKLSSIQEIKNALDNYNGSEATRDLRDLNWEIIQPIKNQLMRDNFFDFFDMVYNIKYYHYNILMALENCKTFPILRLVSLMAIYEKKEAVYCLEKLLEFIGNIPDDQTEKSTIHDNIMDRTDIDLEYNREFESVLRPCQKSLSDTLDEIVIKEITERRLFD